MQKAEISTIQFVKTGKDTPKMLDFVNQAFDQMTFSVAPLIIFPQDFGPLVRGDNRLDTSRQQVFNKILRGIAAIRNQMSEIKTIQQRLGLGAVVALTGGQPPTQGIAQGIDCDMDFAAKTPATPPQGLFSIFFVHQPRRDEPGPLYYQSSRFPYQGHQQKRPTSAPKRPFRTTLQSVYRRYSNGRIQQGANAIGPHSDLSISPLPPSGDRLPHLFPHKLSALPAKSLAPLPILRRLILYLSCHHFMQFSQMSTLPSITT